MDHSSLQLNVRFWLANDVSQKDRSVRNLLRSRRSLVARECRFVVVLSPMD